MKYLLIISVAAAFLSGCVSYTERDYECLSEGVALINGQDLPSVNKNCQFVKLP